MNLLKTKFQRTTSVVAGSLLGLAGVAILAAPASAHSPSAKGTASCVDADGKWTVDWKIGNDFNTDATVSSVSATTDKGDAVKVTGAITDAKTIVPANSAYHHDGQVAGATEATKAGSVTLKVVLLWPADGYTNDGKNGNRDPYVKTVYKPTEKCQPSTPVTTPATTPATTSPATPTEGTTSPSSPTPTETTPELPVPTPSTTDEPNVFTPILEEDCTTITIGADNPADGIEWKFAFKTSKGEQRTFTLKPGEKKSEKFSATEGFWVKVTISVTVEGKTYSDYTTVNYDKPDNCSGGSGGGLPVTGAAAGGIAGGAAVLLALGAVLFVMARRRKVRFTA